MTNTDPFGLWSAWGLVNTIHHAAEITATAALACAAAVTTAADRHPGTTDGSETLQRSSPLTQLARN